MEETHERGCWSSTADNLLESQYPLHRACRDGDIEALSLLLAAGPDTDFYQEDGLYGWTPIHWAAHFGKFTCLMRLIENGCNCDYSTERLNQTPLHMAAQNGKGHCLKWLLHCGAAINRQDYLGETPIHKAAKTGNMECVSLLISQGAKLSIRNHSGQIPAQLAASNGHQECSAYIERAAQIEQTHGVYEPVPVLNPSSGFIPDSQQNGQVTNGEAMEDEDDDMDTDLSVVPKGHRVNPLAGTKRMRDSCDDEECKKSRRDEPAHWTNQNGFFQHLNGCNQLNNGWQNQNGIVQHADVFSHHVDKKHSNGFLQMPNGYHPFKIQSLNACNNNNICESSSTMEHYSSISQQQGYDSLLMQSFSKTYDGS